MKKGIHILTYSLATLLTVVLFSHCEPEPFTPDYPSVSLSTETGYIYQDTILERGEEFRILITAAPGTYDLNLLAINENDSTKLSQDRIISGIDINPTELNENDAMGFTREITLLTQMEGDVKYTIYVEDSEGYTEGVEFRITDIYFGLDTVASELQVYNFTGNPSESAIDLYNARIVDAQDPEADIQDLGINTSLPDETNWYQQIRPKNDCILLKPKDTLDYEQINTKEALIAAAELASVVPLSSKLSAGDMYFAKTPSIEGDTMDYFLLRVNEISIVPFNDEDYYIFSLKQAKYR